MLLVWVSLLLSYSSLERFWMREMGGSQGEGEGVESVG